MRIKKLEVGLSDSEIEDWSGLPPSEIEEMLRQGATDRLLGKFPQNPGHPIYAKGYGSAVIIDPLIEIVYKVFGSKK